MLKAILKGAAAGAAGTTALNATTYADMIFRGRPASSTPEDTVEQLADIAHVTIPGEDQKRDSRVSALGALSGISTGVSVGAVLGLLRAIGWRPSFATGTAAATTVALLGANVPMTALGITDPRTWSAQDWLSDLVPHVVYGLVTAATLDALDP